MAVLKIVKHPHPVLHRRAEAVPRVTESVRALSDDMLETMYAAQGVGLAAPQVGKSWRVIVLQMPDEEPIAIINPEIVKRAGEQEVNEGCLSVPGYFGEIKRSASVTVKGQDRQGKAIRIKGTGLMAEALEHEIDHLNGTLYLDHVESQDKLHKIECPIAPEAEHD